MTGDGSGLLLLGVVTVEGVSDLIRGGGADLDIMFSVLDLTEVTGSVLEVCRTGMWFGLNMQKMNTTLTRFTLD